MRYGRSPDRPAHVALSAHATGTGIAITVRDHGAGVPEDALERLLQPFARMDDERSERGGSGLGLAIVERLARRYGGQLRLVNATGGGLEASLTLPDYGTSIAAVA
jgi:two-component system osmolarity sensor histidine kinase EnvZ